MSSEPYEARVSVCSLMAWWILRAAVVSHCKVDTVTSISLVFSSCLCPCPWLAPMNLTDFRGRALSASERVRRKNKLMFPWQNSLERCRNSCIEFWAITHMKRFSPHFFLIEWRHSEGEHPLNTFTVSWFQRSCSTFRQCSVWDEIQICSAPQLFPLCLLSILNIFNKVLCFNKKRKQKIGNFTGFTRSTTWQKKRHCSWTKAATLQISLPAPWPWLPKVGI